MALSAALAVGASAQGSRVQRVLSATATIPASAADVVRATTGTTATLSAEAPLVVAPGFTCVRVKQAIAGSPVLRGDALVVFEDGVPVALVAGDTPDAGAPAPPLLDAAEAAAIAAGAPQGDRLKLSEDASGWTRIAGPALPQDTFARLVALPHGPRLAWRVEIAERDDSQERWCVIVDARDGSVLERSPLTAHAAARGRVFPRGFPGGAEMRDFVDGDVVTDAASPAGWIDATDTIGNNVSVWDDRAGDGTATSGLTAQGTGDPLTFDFPVTGVPLDDLDAALTNVFWALDDAHDRFWRLGFGEASGALQVRNFGRGGVQNDSLRVFVQYRAGASATGIRNTSGATTSADGSYASVNFGLWDRSGEIRDGALDTPLVVHEYAHHVVIRMSGGDGTCDDGTQPAGLAEGWADYFAASFTGERVMGAWVTGNATNGLRLAPVGGSSMTYANLCANAIYPAACSSSENGEIWSSALWDLRGELIREHGPGGAELADRLVVAGLRFTPCRPSFVEARDGLLLADLALTGGSERCLIWQVMANRGIGWGASSAGPDDRFPVAGYAMPPECAASSSIAWDRARYGDDADAALQLADARGAGATRTVRVTSSSGDSEDVAAQPPAGAAGLVRIVSVALRPGTASPGDGTLQVRDGDTVAATCVDCPGMPAATALVSRSLALTVVSHQLSSESCHDDDDDPTLTDFRAELPSLLDAGELATLSVTLGNAEDFPLDDVRVRVACDDLDVSVLPLGEIAVGRVRGRDLNPSGFTITLRALAAPSPAVSPGDRATLTFDVTARGLRGTTSMTLELAGDYAAERAVSAWGGPETFETTSPSVSSWTHAPAGGEPADAWDLRACGRGGGRAMTYSGASCGTYADTPSAATLVSPPVFDFGNKVQAVHPVGLSWWNDVDLGVSSSNNLCDSEMVVAYLTDNLARPSYAAPLADRNGTLQYWAQWPSLGNTRNTSGWVQAFPGTAVSTSSVTGMSPPNVRLLWAFFTDVYNPGNSGTCRAGDREGVGRGYHLDDVSFTYDLARIVPAANTACAATCGVRAVLQVSPPGGARCAGDPITLSARGSEAAGCAGALEYRFTGPGGFDTGYTAADTSTTAALDGATWTVAARCATGTSCSQSVSVADPTKDDVDAGRVRPASLRVRREGDDVVLSWDGTRSPPSYAIFRASMAPADGAARATSLLDLSTGPPTAALRRASSDALDHRDAGAAIDGIGLEAYRVLSRVPCEGSALDR